LTGLRTTEADTPDLPVVLREMLHEQIFGVLKRNLMMGRFAPGQKLPLRGLAKSLGTSLMPVRDALQRLESLGCLVSTGNRTMTVPVFSIKELEDIRTLRILLEGTAAGNAATLRTEDELADLKQYCIDIEISAETHNLDLFLEANYKFHMSIAAMSRLAFIGNLLESLWMRIGPAVRQSKPNEDHIRKAVKFHWRAYQAIATQDALAAVTAIRDDILGCNDYSEWQA
jgi:GntR family colanic acid and biofilm gene transcriptional regulator